MSDSSLTSKSSFESVHEPQFEVHMRCVTWSRDSHGLFDYESRYIAKKNIKTTTSGRIIRLNNDVELIDLDLRPEDVDATAKPLITIV
jgi:hypothetical protein